MNRADAWVPPWLTPVWDRLGQAEAAGRLPHALLFDGPPGWGKRFLVRQFGRLLLGLAPRSPTLMAHGDEPSDGDLLAHRDVRVVQREASDSGRLRRQILIEQVRALGEFLVRTAGSGGRRIAIIELAEELNVSAANALLKRLEEPGAGCHLLLVSERISEVLPTIRSRCQRLPIAPGDAQLAEAWLSQQLPAAEDAERLLRLVGGAPLLARQRMEEGLPALADAVAAFLDDGVVEPLLENDRDRADRILELLYRGLAARVRERAAEPDPFELRYMERVLWARRVLLSQSNPNVTLLLEDLLLGRSQMARAG